jgi:hypothetical protein
VAAEEMARDALHLAKNTENLPLSNHDVRSCMFSELLAERENICAGYEYSSDVSYACAMHDLGIASEATGTAALLEGALARFGRADAPVNAGYHPNRSTVARPALIVTLDWFRCRHTRILDLDGPTDRCSDASSDGTSQKGRVTT